MDDFPQKICKICVESIKDIVSFLNKCEKSREDLENQLDPLRHPPESVYLGFERVEFLEDDIEDTKMVLDGAEVSYSAIMDMCDEEIKKENETIDGEEAGEHYPLLDTVRSDDENEEEVTEIENATELEEGVSEVESELDDGAKSDEESDYIDEIESKKTKETKNKELPSKKPKRKYTKKKDKDAVTTTQTSGEMQIEEEDDEDVQYEESPSDLVCNICGRRYKKQVSVIFYLNRANGLR